MTGLSNDTNYYLVRTGNLTFSLATSLANAQNGTLISLSSDGSGAQTFTLTLTTRTRGDTGGESSHAMSKTEFLAHTHVAPTASGEANNVGSTGFQTTIAGTTSSVGGNAAMNIMNPFVVLNFLIKF
jgi:microcystin-dependent protein